jgi:hypothetical protein
MEGLKCLPENIFGLSEAQINKSRSEIDKIYSTTVDVKLLPEPDFIDGKWVYRDFTTNNKLSNDNLVKALKFSFNLIKIEDLFSNDIKGLVTKCLSLVNMMNENDWNDLINTANEIRVLIMNLLETSNDLNAIVGLYKITVNLNRYLNLN